MERAVLSTALFFVIQGALYLGFKNGHVSKPKDPRPVQGLTPIATSLKDTYVHTTVRARHHTYAWSQAHPGPSTTTRCGYGLKWTSLLSGKDDKTAFFSAYFDERQHVPDRPAVVILGYQMKSLKDLQLRCLFTFSNGSSACSSQPVTGLGSYCINIHDDGKLATSYAYVCRLDCAATKSCCSADEIPLSVSMSVGSNCANGSETIPVQDCRGLKTMRPSERKSIGVCPSPVYGLGRQDIVEFIEINRALGVGLVSLYLIPGALDNDTIKYLYEKYSQSGMLEMFHWKQLYMHKIVHYNGQLLSTYDCMYRNMYRVDYLIVEDLDEVIIPLQHDNYQDMIGEISTGGQPSFRFLNRFFAINKNPPETLSCHTFTLQILS